MAAELRITKAALHYHYAAKAQLGEALVARYESDFSDLLRAIEGASEDAGHRLTAYIGVYRDALREQRMCLCGMLAAEYQTLPSGMQAAVARFFEMNEAWLEGILGEGRQVGALAFAGSARDAGRVFIAGLEGALVLSRATQDVARFDVTADALLAGVLPAGSNNHRQAEPRLQSGPLLSTR